MISIFSILFYGNVYDNPKFEDGEFVHTFEVDCVTVRDGYFLANTENSIYKLSFNTYAVYAESLLRAFLSKFNLRESLYNEIVEFF